MAKKKKIIAQIKKYVGNLDCWQKSCSYLNLIPMNLEKNIQFFFVEVSLQPPTTRIINFPITFN